MLWRCFFLTVVALAIFILYRYEYTTLSPCRRDEKEEAIEKVRDTYSRRDLEMKLSIAIADRDGSRQLTESMAGAIKEVTKDNEALRKQVASLTMEVARCKNLAELATITANDARFTLKAKSDILKATQMKLEDILKEYGQQMQAKETDHLTLSKLRLNNLDLTITNKTLKKQLSELQDKWEKQLLQHKLQMDIQLSDLAKGAFLLQLNREE